MTSIYRKKIERLREGGEPRVLDLFAGCGGISLGFHSNGCNIIGAVELDPMATSTHALNFFRGEDEDTIRLHSVAHDITKLEPEAFLNSLGYDDHENAVDIIVGGPPCQAFARVGRAKLREVAEHPEAFLKDARGNLYLRYLHFVKKTKPVAILMENVPDVLNYGGHNIAEETCEVLEDLGYNCKYTLLNSVYYGVPQMRERMFLVAISNEIKEEFNYPEPSHWVDLPVGYHGSRQVALKYIKSDLFSGSNRYVDPPRKEKDQVLPAVTVEEALKDLPKIDDHLKGKLKRGARKFDRLFPYPENHPISAYGKLMRNWKGFENKDGIYDHVIRYLPRDYPIFKRMNPGDQYPEAYKHAHDMFKERLATLKKKGLAPDPDSPKYEELKKEIVPGYDPNKFPNKWRKLEADMPSRTLMAHLGKDSYSHIHYDSEQARTISVREAARLQSFPDGFKFAGAMNAAFRQIGNAVPPLVSKAIAEKILETIQIMSYAEEVSR